MKKLATSAQEIKCFVPLSRQPPGALVAVDLIAVASLPASGSVSASDARS
jgi:hypothetical protein